MYKREESGYGSADSDLEMENPPSPNLPRIGKDAIRLEEDFEISKLLMNSANGIIYEGFCLKSGKSVIFKQLPRINIPNWIMFDGHLVPAEIGYHFLAYEKSRDLGVICRPITWLEKKSSFVLVIEKGQNSMDLFELSKKYGKLSEEPVKIIFDQLVKMWKSLNISKVCHRDLKDENIIINIKTLECKLIDFGCSTKLSENSQKSFSGTPEFYPPEWFRHKIYNHQKLNAWSIGMILFILLTGDLPVGQKENIIYFDLERDAADLLENISKPAKDILKALLEPEPSKRADLEKTEKLFKIWNQT